METLFDQFGDSETTSVFIKAIDDYQQEISRVDAEKWPILLALKADGSKMFAPKDKVDLMKNVDPEFLTEIGNAILGVDEQSAESEQKERQEIAKK